jgi:hypothetical protein
MNDVLQEKSLELNEIARLLVERFKIVCDVRNVEHLNCITTKRDEFVDFSVLFNIFAESKNHRLTQWNADNAFRCGGYVLYLQLHTFTNPDNQSLRIIATFSVRISQIDRAHELLVNEDQDRYSRQFIDVLEKTVLC